MTYGVLAPEEHGGFVLVPTRNQLMLSRKKSTSGSVLLHVGSIPRICGEKKELLGVVRFSTSCCGDKILKKKMYFECEMSPIGSCV